MRNIKYEMLPDHMQGGMRRYVENGIQPGSFLTALLSNDFMEAARKADNVNLHNLYIYASFFHNELPEECYGSPAAVKSWSALGGLAGGADRGSI